LVVRQNDPVQAAWLKVCKKLAKVGLARAQHEGPEDYAARIIAARPQLADTMHDIAKRYTDLRYAGANDEDALRAFKAAANAFRL
jgi:ribosomal protein S21